MQPRLQIANGVDDQRLPEVVRSVQRAAGKFGGKSQLLEPRDPGWFFKDFSPFWDKVPGQKCPLAAKTVGETQRCFTNLSAQYSVYLILMIY
ncbi:hypothetical protein CNMCM5623_001038 [Aspergillus felis]|uniref:Uncharacterized protein n=1 Tax=Aspergillus felis TaxID=1287682 RepID=A0A8H6Q7I2_9EURO|nr:hypothetical protein CNMCM5623_001038 [Aspergillus felis]